PGLDIEEAIQLVKNAGGLTVLAHPISYFRDPFEINQLVEYGIDGIEVFHPKQFAPYTNQLNQVAEKHDLFITGGSDFHGLETDVEPGDSWVGVDVIAQMKSYLGR